MNIKGDMLANIMICSVSLLQPRPSDTPTPLVVLSFFPSVKPKISFFVVSF